MAPKFRLSTLAHYWPLIFPVVAFLAFCSFQIADPLTNDEVWEFYASQKLFEVGKATTVTGEVNAYHPYGYYFFQGVAQLVFGENEVSARLIGLLSTLGCFLILLAILDKLGRLTPASAMLCAAFYLLSPAVVQGSLIITADTGMHHLVITGFLWAVIASDHRRARDLAVLVLLCAAMLWIKLVTPVLVVGGAVLYFLIRGDWGSAWRHALVVGFGGGATFAATWAAYAKLTGIPPFDVFTYLWDVAGSRVPSGASSKIVSTGRNTLTLLLWISVPYTLLLLGAAWRTWRDPVERRSPVGLLIVIALCLGLVHTVVSGITIGFPRYHFTMLPICAVIAAYSVAPLLADTRRRWSLAIGTGLATAVFFLVVGDPIDAINFDLKRRVLALPEVGAPSWGSIGLPILCIVPPMFALAWASRRRPYRWQVGLAVLTIASYVALDFQQATAEYNTGYSYGERGTRDLIAYCTERLDEGRDVVSCKDIVFHTAQRSYMQDWRWGERDYLLDRFRAPETQFVVMGVQQNTIGQLRRMWEDPEFATALEGYERRRIGSYFVWERP